MILLFSAMQANADAVTLAKTSEGNNTLSWNFADANTFTEVFEKKDGGSFKRIDTQGEGIGSITFKNKANGKYTYKLDGCYTGRDTPICSRRIVLTASTRVGPQRPTVPGLNVPGSADAGRSFAISTTKVLYATYYQWRLKEPGKTWGRPTRTTVLSRRVSHSKSGLYSYQVRACGKTNLCSGWREAPAINIRRKAPNAFAKGIKSAKHFSQSGELVRATTGQYTVTHGHLNYHVPLKLPSLPGGMRPDIRMAVKSEIGRPQEVFATERASDLTVCYAKKLQSVSGGYLADKASPHVDDSLSLMRLCYRGATLEPEGGPGVVIEGAKVNCRTCGTRVRKHTPEAYWEIGNVYRSPQDPTLRITLLSDKEVRVEKGNGDKYRYVLSPNYPKNLGLYRDKNGVVLSPDRTDNRASLYWSLVEMRSVFGATITYDYTPKKTGGLYGPSVVTSITYSNGYLIEIGSRVRGDSGRAPELVVYNTSGGSKHPIRMYYAEYGHQDLNTDPIAGSLIKTRMSKVFECGFPKDAPGLSSAICAKPLKPRFKQSRYTQLAYDGRELRHRDFSQTWQYLESVEDGFGYKVTFEYAKDSDKSVFPEARHSNSAGVVTRVSTNTGQAYRYHYGLPILGIDSSAYAFESVTKVNEHNFTYEKTDYDFTTAHNHLPLIRRIESGVTNKSGNWPFFNIDGALPSQITTHHHKPHPESPWYHYRDNSVTKHYLTIYDINSELFKHESSFTDTIAPRAVRSALIGWTHIDREVDQFGTETKVTTRVADRNDKNMHITVRTGSHIQNDTDAWLIGFVQDDVVRSTRYGLDTVSQPVVLDAKSVVRTSSAMAGTTEIEKTSTYTFTPSSSPTFVRSEITERNSRGLVTRTAVKADGVERATTYSNYDIHGFPGSIANALGHRSTMTYDPRFGDIATLTDANGLRTTTRFSPFGEVVQQTNARGVATNIIDFYCSNADVSCPSQALYARATTVTHPYGAFGAPTTIEYFDSQGRNVGDDIVTPSGDHNRVTNSYYPDGSVKTRSTRAVSDGRRRHGYSYWYSNGQPLGEVSPTGLKNLYQHSILPADDSPTSVRYTTSARDGTRVHKTRINILGQVEAINDPSGTNPAFNLGTQVDYTYDAHGNLATTTVNNDPKTAVRVQYNPSGQRVTMDDPSAGKIAFTYTGFGELKTQTWAPNTANAKSMTYFYDRLGRQTKRIEKAADGKTSEFGWEWDRQKKGRMDRSVSHVKGNSYAWSEAYQYNYYAEVKKKTYRSTVHNFGSTKPKGNVISIEYHYDVFGREIQTNYDNIFRTAKTYFGSGFPYSMSEVAVGKPSRLIYQNSVDSFNFTTGSTLFGNGIVSTRRYDALGRLTDIESGLHKDDGGLTKTAQDLSYTYNAFGNLKTRRTISPKHNTLETFGYDSLNRIKTVSLSGYNYLANSYSKARSHYYNYDKLGNLTYRSDKGIVAGNSHSAQNIWYGQTNNAGIHAVTHAFGVGTERTSRVNYSYDAYGNVILRDGKKIAYNVFNKPTNIDGVTFSYGADRQRFLKTSNKEQSFQYLGQQKTFYLEGGRFKFVIEGYRTTKEITVDNTLVYKETYYNNELNLTERDFLLADHLGSVSVASNEKGKVTSRAQYNAWGEQIHIDGYLNSTTVMGFTGHETLRDNLVHMGGRVYDSAAARFMSADLFVQSPLNGQSFNRYSYVFNNPLGYTDPTGYMVSKDCNNVDTKECNGMEGSAHSACIANLLAKCRDKKRAEREELKRQLEFGKIRAYLARARDLQNSLGSQLFDALSGGTGTLDYDILLKLAATRLIISQLEKILSLNRVSSGSSRDAFGSSRRGKHSESGGGDSQEGSEHQGGGTKVLFNGCNNGDNGACSALKSRNQQDLKIAYSFIQKNLPALTKRVGGVFSQGNREKITFNQTKAFRKGRKGIDGETSPYLGRIEISSKYSSLGSLVNTLAHELTHSGDGYFGRLRTQVEDRINSPVYGPSHQNAVDIGDQAEELFNSINSPETNR